MAIEQTLGFSSTVFRKKFRSAMTVRSYQRQRDHFFARGQSRCSVLYPERYG